jgi:hypothetical protein
MVAERLPTEFWVMSQLRRLSGLGQGAYLIRRGDTERGTVIVRLVSPAGLRILTQVRDLDGELGWMAVKDNAVMLPDEADAYVERAVARDSDLWVIEVETKGDENPFAAGVVA